MKKILLLPTVIIILSMFSMMVSAVNVTSCSGTSLASDTEYHLTQDLLQNNEGTPCLKIGGSGNRSNILIDCHGYNIYYNKSQGFIANGIGTSNENYNNITIQNCVIHGFPYVALNFFSTRDIYLINNTFYNNGWNETYGFGNIYVASNNDDITNGEIYLENNNFINTSINPISNVHILIFDPDTVTIRNNRFTGENTEGVTVFRYNTTADISNIELSGNNFTNIGKTPNGDKQAFNLYLYAVGGQNGDVDTINIFNNRVVDSVGGFYINGDGIETFVHSGNFYNNYFENVTSTTANSYALNLYRLNNSNIYSNQFYNTSHQVTNDNKAMNIFKPQNTNIYNNILVRQSLGIYAQGINTNVLSHNINIYDNYFENIAHYSFTYAVFLQYVNNSNIYNNELINLTGDNGNDGGIGFYIRYGYDSNVYSNQISYYNFAGIRGRDSDGIDIYNNTCTNPNHDYSFDYAPMGFCVDVRNAINSEVYDNTMDGTSSTIFAWGIRVRDTATGTIIHDNTFYDGGYGVGFLSGGTYTNNHVYNNDFYDNTVGIEFFDNSDDINVTNNNIYDNTVQINGTVARNVTGNYYVDGTANQTTGLCLIQPYNEGVINDYYSYCCINGWDTLCYVAPVIYDYTPTYTASDLPKSVIDVGMKILLGFGFFAVVIGLAVLIRFFRKTIKR